MKITPTPAQVAAMMRPKRSKYNVDRSAAGKAKLPELPQAVTCRCRTAAGAEIMNLSGGAIDTLYKLAKAYPHDVDAGDIPSKTGRDELLRLGLAEYVAHEGTTHLNAAGMEAYRKRKAAQDPQCKACHPDGKPMPEETLCSKHREALEDAVAAQESQGVKG